MSGGDRPDWFVPVRRRNEARSRLLVIPHAGSGPAAVTPLAEAMPPEVEVWSANLPGRQARQSEPPCTDLAEVVAAFAAELRRRDDLPYGLLGYCGGALLGYLTAAESSPRCLFVSGLAAPDVAVLPRRLHQFPADRFWEAVLAQGGISPELGGIEELRAVFEPALRADFALYAQYYEHLPPLAVPLHVLYGRDDASIGRGALLGWRRRSSRPTRLVELPGGHWILDDAPTAVAAYVHTALLAEVDGAGGAG